MTPNFRNSGCINLSWLVHIDGEGDEKEEGDAGKHAGL